MKPLKSLLKQYEQVPEAKEFIDKHRRELPVMSYEEDELNHFKRYQKTYDISDTIATDYIYLLENKLEQDYMYDFYYNNLSYEELELKYPELFTKKTGAKVKVPRKVTQSIKRKIVSKYNKYIGDKLKSRSKFISKNKVSNNYLTKASIFYRNKRVILYLFKVDPKNRIIYDNVDPETLESLKYKADLVFSHLSDVEKPIIRSFLRNINNETFNSIFPILRSALDILGQYRWINSNGFLITPEIDIVISELKVNNLINLFE